MYHIKFINYHHCLCLPMCVRVNGIRIHACQYIVHGAYLLILFSMCKVNLAREDIYIHRYNALCGTYM